MPIPIALTYFADKIATIESVSKAVTWLTNLGFPLLSPYKSLWVGMMLVYVPAGINLLLRMAKDQNNTTPRTVIAKMQKESPLFDRLQCCHQALLETYPMFAASVLSAVQAGVDVATVSSFGTLWCAARIVFIAAYAGGVNEAIGMFRTLSFAVCVALQGALLLLAAAK